MKKIFMALTFALCIIFSAMVLAGDLEEDGIEVTTDDIGNVWYVDPTNVIIDKNSDDELIFHATFTVIFSDKGQKELVDFYRTQIENAPGLDTVTMIIEKVHFRKVGDKTYSSATDVIFYDKDKKVIEGLGYVDYEVEWQPINAKTVSEEMYQVARLYAK